MSKIHSYNGVDYEPKNVNGELIELTDAECEVLLQQTTAWNNASATRKLAEIRTIRNQLLQDTDWKVTMAKEKGTTLTNAFKTYRDNLRNIPADYTTEAKYDELLEKNDDGSMKHSVWSE